MPEGNSEGVMGHMEAIGLCTAILPQVMSRDPRAHPSRALRHSVFGSLHGHSGSGAGPASPEPVLQKQPLSGVTFEAGPSALCSMESGTVGRIG